MHTLLQRYQLILSARRIAASLSADLADRFIVEHTGSYLKATTNQFFNDKRVVDAGISRRTPKAKILATLRKLEKPQTTHVC